MTCVQNVVACRSVTTAQVWTGNCIYCSIWYTTRNCTFQYYTLTHTHTHTLVAIVMVFPAVAWKRTFSCLWAPERSSTSATSSSGLTHATRVTNSTNSPSSILALFIPPRHGPHRITVPHCRFVLLPRKHTCLRCRHIFVILLSLSSNESIYHNISAA
jgi:hypothetical protein